MPGEALDAIVRTMALPIAAGICLNQIDELFVDANYWLRGLYRRKERLISTAELRNVEQKRIAIMVPSWREAEVIEQMLLHNLKTIDYDPDCYVIFCGTYKNDAETQSRIDAVAKRFRSVRKVIVPHDGPTSKADCLNWIYQGVLLEERRRGIRFDILLMHDAEDVIHPLSLRLYSLLIPENDFVQTPVFSLAVSPKKIVAGTYIDEFAEHHLKDMLVREVIGGFVPSAGVGSAFGRDAFEELAESRGLLPFNTQSLTEDYEIGLQIRLLGRKAVFACRAFLTEDGREEYIATREYFPDQFQASVRQRSRWVCGITLQTWAQIGWKGSLPVLYCLWRDRKAPWTNALVALAYFLFVYVVARWAWSALTGGDWSTEDLFEDDSVLAVLVGINLGMMAWRALMRFWFVRKLYGLGHAAMSVPRLVASNVINVMATARALGQYLKHRWTGQPLRWLKTTHAFPTAVVLNTEGARLGEILRDFHGIPEASIRDALSIQERTRLPLGRILAGSGVASSRVVAAALAMQWGLDVAELDPRAPSRALLEKLPESEAERFDVLPMGESEGTVVLAASKPLLPDARAELEKRFQARVAVRIAPEKWLERARLRTYRRLHHDADKGQPRLGEWLVGKGYLSPTQLTEALDEHWETGRHLGEVLLRKGIVGIEALRMAMPHLGDRFVRVRPEDVDQAAVERIGIGLCAMYEFAPIETETGAKAVASVRPLHRDVVERVEARLGGRVQRYLAPRQDVMWAIGQSLLRLPQARFSMGLSTFDLEAFAQRSGIRLEGSASLGQSSAKGRERLDSRLPKGLLPDRWVAEVGIRLEELEHHAMVLSCPRPVPRLSRELGWLLPNWKIAWRTRSNEEGMRGDEYEVRGLINARFA